MTEKISRIDFRKLSIPIKTLAKDAKDAKDVKSLRKTQMLAKDAKDGICKNACERRERRDFLGG